MPSASISFLGNGICIIPVDKGAGYAKLNAPAKVLIFLYARIPAEGIAARTTYGASMDQLIVHTHNLHLHEGARLDHALELIAGFEITEWHINSQSPADPETDD